jgi:acyl-CoA thioesterase-1
MRSHNGGLSIRVRMNLRALAFVALTALGGGAAQAAEVVCLGASGTQGYGLSPNEAFPAQLEAMLHAKGVNVTVSNAGVGGDTTAGMLARFDDAVDSSTRVLVLQRGTNDSRDRIKAKRGTYGSRDPIKPEETKANIDQIRAKAAARHIKVIDAQKLIAALPDSARLGDEIGIRTPRATA